MKIIEFNGLGQPRDEARTTGSVLLLVTGAMVSVVKVELLPVGQHGPMLHRALNDHELQGPAAVAVAAAFPDGLDCLRHWVVECPPEIAAAAQFDADI